MSTRSIWLNLGGLGLLIALLGLVYWTNTGVRAVPGLIDDLQSDDTQAQALAAMHLGHIGPAASAAVPALVAMATTASISYAATSAAGSLPTIDLSAARQIMEQHLPNLKNPDPQVRRAAAALLGALGPVAKPAVHSLAGMLNDPSTVVREQVVRALGSIGLPHDSVLQGLIQALHDPEPTVRHAAVSQFTFSGFSSPEALAVLRDLTKDSDRTVAQLAQSAVASAGRPIQAAVYAMMLNQGTNRTYTLHQLAKLGQLAAHATPGIAAILTAEHPLERYLAASALEEIGPAAKESAPALQRALHDTDPMVREAVAAALQSIGNKTSRTP